MSLMDAPQRHAAAHRHLRPPQRRQVEPAQRHHAPGRLASSRDFAGTTTDPVEKPMELLPLGPVLFIDTAGIDDVGALGELRVERRAQVFDRTDLGVIVTEAGSWGEFEDGILDEFRERKTPVVVVFNKIDLVEPAGAGAGACRTSRSRRVLDRRQRGRAASSTSARRCSTRRRRTSSTTRRSSATSSAPASWPCSWCPSTRRRRGAA